MKLADKVGIQGFFKICAIRTDGTEEVLEEKNLIMDKARTNMAELISGKAGGLPINQILLGTKGYNPDSGNLLDPIQVGTYDFFPERLDSFSENQLEFFYRVKFDTYNPVDIDGNPVLWTDNVLDMVGTGNRLDMDGTELDAENADCPIKMTVQDNIITYEFTIPENAANGYTADSTTAYTEAALYAGGDIFSLKTFSARVKEETVRFVITWSIQF